MLAVKKGCISFTVDHEGVDKVNVLQASLFAMEGAVKDLETKHLGEKIDALLVDGNKPLTDIPCDCETIVKGDSSSFTIAAASVIAKV